MTTELQNKAWSILPKEFKENVKWLYKDNNNDDYAGGYSDALRTLFGIHNLTSDVEGEEMLTCEKGKVQYRIHYAKGGVEENPDYYNGYAQAIYDLFGSKCLPDANEVNFASIEPKPAEPEEPTCTDTCTDDCPSQSRNLSQEIANCDKQFDNILKDSFREHNRLYIAAMMAQGILSCDLCQNPESLAKSALHYADALIAEAEKGGAVGNS